MKISEKMNEINLETLAGLIDMPEEDGAYSISDNTHEETDYKAILDWKNKDASELNKMPTPVDLTTSDAVPTEKVAEFRAMTFEEKAQILQSCRCCYCLYNCNVCGDVEADACSHHECYEGVAAAMHSTGTFAELERGELLIDEDALIAMPDYLLQNFLVGVEVGDAENFLSEECFECEGDGSFVLRAQKEELATFYVKDGIICRKLAM